MSLGEKIKKYSDLTLFNDLPIGTLFSFFYSTSMYCKVSANNYMDLSDTKNCIYHSYHLQVPVIPLLDLSGEECANSALVQFSSLKDGDLFVRPENLEEDTFYLYKQYQTDKNETYFYVIEYEEDRGSDTYLEASMNFGTIYRKNLFVLPLKDLQVIHHNDKGMQYVTLEKKDKV